MRFGWKCDETMGVSRAAYFQRRKLAYNTDHPWSIGDVFDPNIAPGTSWSQVHPGAGNCTSISMFGIFWPSIHERELLHAIS